MRISGVLVAAFILLGCAPAAGQSEAREHLGRAEAVEAFRKAVRLRPDDVRACYGLAVASADLGSDADALKAAERAVSLRPDFAEAFFVLSCLHYRAGRYGEALGAAERAASLKPDYAEAHENIGIIYNATGAFADAAEALTRAVRIRPGASAYLHLGHALNRLGRLAKAAAAFKRATMLQPDSATARYSLGMVSLDLRLKAEALKQHRKLVALDAGLARKLYLEIYKDRLLDAGRGWEPR